VQSTSADDGSALSAGVFAESLRAAVGRPAPEKWSRAVIEMAVGTAPCDQASITTLGKDRVLETVASSDARITKADCSTNSTKGPTSTRSGPTGCFRCARRGRRFPLWVSTAEDTGTIDSGAPPGRQHLTPPPTAHQTP
jgi:hypothetical protein